MSLLASVLLLGQVALFDPPQILVDGVPSTPREAYWIQNVPGLPENTLAVQLNVWLSGINPAHQGICTTQYFAYGPESYNSTRQNHLLCYTHNTINTGERQTCTGWVPVVHYTENGIDKIGYYQWWQTLVDGVRKNTALVGCTSGYRIWVNGVLLE